MRWLQHCCTPVRCVPSTAIFARQASRLHNSIASSHVAIMARHVDVDLAELDHSCADTLHIKADLQLRWRGGDGAAVLCCHCPTGAAGVVPPQQQQNIANLFTKHELQLPRLPGRVQVRSLQRDKDTKQLRTLKVCKPTRV